eukprot:2787462-Pyramimonas_sp.AAC.1
MGCQRGRAEETDPVHLRFQHQPKVSVSQLAGGRLCCCPCARDRMPLVPTPSTATRSTSTSE